MVSLGDHARHLAGDIRRRHLTDLSPPGLAQPLANARLADMVEMNVTSGSSRGSMRK